MALDLSSAEAIVDPVQWFWYSLLLRLTYLENVSLRRQGLACAGPCVYAQGANVQPLFPDWLAGRFGDDLVIACSGTQNVEQFLYDLAGVAQVRRPPWPGQVHGYFAIATDAVWADFAAKAGPLMPVPRVTILGHSLGGAVAQLLAWYVEAIWPGTVQRVCVEGCPRVGNPDFAANHRWQVTRLENTLDVVPLVPPERGASVPGVTALTGWHSCDYYVPTGSGRLLRSDGYLTVPAYDLASQADLGALATWIFKNNPANAFAHLAVEYAQRLRYRLPGSLPTNSPRGIELVHVDALQLLLSDMAGEEWQQVS